MFDIVTRAQAVILKAVGESLAVIEQQTGITGRQVRNIWNATLARGWTPGTPLTTVHVTQARRPGRPKKVTAQLEEDIIRSITNNRYGREKTLRQLAREFNLSREVIRKILRKRGYKKTKPTRKPGLTQAMREARLHFAKRYEHWTIEDWKQVIWTDETSVVLGHRRGGYRVWRRSNEAFSKTCVRERWKGNSEFMFWGCFTYYFKGPCHIWKSETVAQKKVATKELNLVNTAIEPECKAQWELDTMMRRLGLRNRPGRKPDWKFTKNNGAFVRSSTGGIDWYRYLHEILLKKLLPFAAALKCFVPNVTIMEDKAPAHASQHQRIYFDVADIERFVWPGNSPDLNMIEPCWAYMKRVTTRNGPLTTRVAAEKAWLQAWNDLEQWRIQRWIERIPHHIKEVIKLEGGNEYKEGCSTSGIQNETRRTQQDINRRNREINRVRQQAYNAFENRVQVIGLPQFYVDYYVSLFTGTLDEVEEVDGWDDEEVASQGGRSGRGRGGRGRGGRGRGGRGRGGSTSSGSTSGGSTSGRGGGRGAAVVQEGRIAKRGRPRPPGPRKFDIRFLPVNQHNP